MSAITGICDFFAMIGSASASSVSGTATRTIWHPEAVSSAICWRVALMSAVFVVVIDWTDAGAPGLLQGCGHRSSDPGSERSVEELDGVDHVGHEGQHGQPDEQQCHHVR